MTLEGNFDFNRMALTPPDTKFIIHEKQGQQKTWDPHGVKVWHMGPDMEHYRRYTVYINKT